MKRGIALPILFARSGLCTSIGTVQKKGGTVIVDNRTLPPILCDSMSEQPCPGGTRSDGKVEAAVRISYGVTELDEGEGHCNCIRTPRDGRRLKRGYHAA